MIPCALECVWRLSSIQICMMFLLPRQHRSICKLFRVLYHFCVELIKGMTWPLLLNNGLSKCCGFLCILGLHPMFLCILCLQSVKHQSAGQRMCWICQVLSEDHTMKLSRTTFTVPVGIVHPIGQRVHYCLGPFHFLRFGTCGFAMLKY